jgi:hypothetical protein
MPQEIKTSPVVYYSQIYLVAAAEIARSYQSRAANRTA